MWIRKTIDVLVMTLLLLGPAVLLSKLDSQAPDQEQPEPQPRTEVSAHAGSDSILTDYLL